MGIAKRPSRQYSSLMGSDWAGLGWTGRLASTATVRLCVLFFCRLQGL